MNTTDIFIDYASQQCVALNASASTFYFYYTALYAVGAIGLLFVAYASWVYKIWDAEFSGQRVMRISEHSPSNKQRPDITRFEEAQARIVANSEQHKVFSKCELIADVKEKQSRLIHSTAVMRAMAKAISFKGLLSTNEVAEKLDMDHDHIRFLDFLWGYIFIGPMSALLWRKGTVWLSVRKYLVRKGIITAEKPDLDALVGFLCLEQSQVINYFAKTKQDSKLGNIAGFFFSDFPYVDNNLNYCVADLFAVDIDLDTKRFVKAKMDDIDLTASETLILLWFNTIAAQHVKLHAMANWGINQHPSLKEINPFLLRNSVATAMYNYFGYSTFSSFFVTWEKQGLLSDGWRKKGSLIKCFNHGIREGVAQHGNITDLVQYSRFVNFAVKVRAIFIHEFVKHKHLFPGIDGEAFFVGTVLHSLDHTLMEWNLPEPLWLDVDDPKFGKMAEMGRIVRVGFVPDVPWLYFQKRFKGSKHPFYKKVYERAAKVDKKLADNMDTCIIK